MSRTSASYLSFSHDDRLLVASGTDQWPDMVAGGAAFFDLDTGATTYSTDWLSIAVFSPQEAVWVSLNQCLAAFAEIALWNTEAHAPVDQIRTTLFLERSFQGIENLTASPSGRYLIWIDEILRVWDSQNSDFAWMLTDWDVINNPPVLAIHPDETVLALTQGYRFELRDLSTGELITGLSDPGSNYTAAQFSPDGNFLVAVSRGSFNAGGGVLRVWSTHDYTVQLATEPQQWGGYHALHFLVDFYGNQDALVVADDDIHFLHVGDNWGEFLSFTPQVGQVSSMANCGAFFAIAGENGYVQLWQLNFGR